MPNKNRSHKEYDLLLEATKSVLEIEDFEKTARRIFNSCKELTGATAGYVALLSKTGEENEVLFLDSGGMNCSVDPSLPMPIRGLRAQAYKTQKTIYDNDFMNSEHIEFIPKGHVNMPNVLFAPLNIQNETVGVIGLSNKKTEFTDEDAQIVTTFGNLCAIALRKSLILQKEKEMAKKVTSLNESLELINNILKHDIINDLQSVMNSVELLDTVNVKNDIYSNIKEQLSNSVGLIVKMNELEKAIRKDMTRTKKIDLNEVVEKCLEKYQNTGIIFEIEGEGEILADQAIYSVVDNLIGNAVKHSKTEKIKIQIYKKENKLYFEVIDYGIGLPEDVISKINTKNYKIDRTNISELGLFIVLKTVDRYDGELEVIANKSNGTIFRIILNDLEQKKYH